MSDGGKEKMKQGGEGMGDLDSFTRKAVAERVMLMKKKEEEQRNRLFEFHLKTLVDMLNVHMSRMRDGNMHVRCEDLEVMNSAFVNMVDMHPVLGLEARKVERMKKRQEMKNWEGVEGDKTAHVPLRDQHKQMRDVEYAKQAVREMSLLVEGRQKEGMKHGGFGDLGSFESCKTMGLNSNNNDAVHMGWQHVVLQQSPQQHVVLQQSPQQQQQQQQQYHQAQQQSQPGVANYDRAGLDMYIEMMMKNGRNTGNEGPGGPSAQPKQQHVQGEEQAEMRAPNPNQSTMMFKRLQKQLLESLQTEKSGASIEATRDINTRDKSSNDKQLMQLICRALNPAGGQDTYVPYGTHIQNEMQKTGKRSFDDDKDAANVLMSLGSVPLEKRAKTTSSHGFRPVRSSSALLTTTRGFIPAHDTTTQAGPSNHADAPGANATMDEKSSLSDLYSFLSQVAGDRNVTRPPF